MFFLLTHPEVFSIVVSIVFRLLSDSLQGCKLKRLSFDNTVIRDVLSGNFSVSLVLKHLCTETLTKVHSEQPDAVWPVYSWLGCRPIVHSPQCAGPAVTADKWSMEINWFHSQSRCLAFYNLWVSHRRCFLKQSPQRPSWILVHIWTLYQHSCFPQIYRNVVLLKTYAGKAYLLICVTLSEFQIMRSQKLTPIVLLLFHSRRRQTDTIETQ